MSIPTLFDKMRENRRRFKPFVREKLYPGDYVVTKDDAGRFHLMHIDGKWMDGDKYVLSDGKSYRRKDFFRSTPEGRIIE